MKVFIAVLVLIFSLQSWTKADDIRDFEIEGMSIGDSLLDFYTKDEIEKNTKDYYSNKTNFPFVAVEIENHKSFKQYHGVQFHIKKNDKNYKIYAIGGYDYCINDINVCYNTAEKIEKDFLNIFKNLEIERVQLKHDADKTGKSTVKRTIFYTKNFDEIQINVFDWDNNMPYSSNYDVSLKTIEYLSAP